MYSAELCQTLIKRFPEVSFVSVPDKFVRDPEPQVRVPVNKLVEVCRFLKTDPQMQFDVPLQMTAVDYIKDNVFELVYYLYSSKKKHALVLKAQVSRADAIVDSVTSVWSGMDWQEREVYDLMGITFKGHPNLKRIMMWEGFPGYPLRKDYVHVTDKYDSGLEVGTPGLNEKGIPISGKN
ncbi:MAG: NAD(P)H-quinone oxidoreductase subunit J, chloroplastic [Elusimicrobia bacterium]|nr:NAD(P)H-quinone oxidoreductase subunit J, chloroplastic [Elusimicrobiota bacterium]